jgi:anti-sigma factor RsiW
MMALSKKMLEHGDVALLLPWHTTGRLSARDASRVEKALAHDPALARQYAVIREEHAETIALNERLGAPSGRALQRLFAAIDAEPERRPPIAAGLAARIFGFFRPVRLPGRGRSGRSCW